MFVATQGGSRVRISAVQSVKVDWTSSTGVALLTMADGKVWHADAQEWATAEAKCSRAVLPAQPGTMLVHQLVEGDWLTEPVLAWSIGVDEEASVYPICHAGMLDEDQAILHPSGHVTQNGAIFADLAEYQKRYAT